MKQKTLSHVQFFRLCEEMRNIREVLESKKPTKVEACRLLEERTHFPVTEHALEQAMKATGVSWLSRKREGMNASKRDQVTRILGNAILHLYHRLGEPIPTALAGIVERANGRLLIIAQTQKVEDQHSRPTGS